MLVLMLVIVLVLVLVIGQRSEIRGRTGEDHKTTDNRTTGQSAARV